MDDDVHIDRLLHAARRHAEEARAELARAQGHALIAAGLIARLRHKLAIAERAVRTLESVADREAA